ncbi:S8 family serine peptidase [Microbacterium sp. P07]|uniref:S8 family serine peptidase n=1 Tax=Microbacterium sp. P07 TaxID=3366952 RepID=UPI00374575C4
MTGVHRARLHPGATAGMLGIVLAFSATPAALAAPTSVSPVRSAVSEQCTAATRIEQAPPALDSLQTEAAWSVTRGAGVTVAVVDSGVSTSNPHLSAAVTGGINLVPDGTDATGSADLYGHGTAIAGQIAARRIDGSGVVGLAPDARILPVRVFAGVDDEQVEAGFGPSTVRIAEGIRAATDLGAQIINVSMSTATPDQALADAVSYATERGSLVIGSSGNRDSTLAVEENDGDGARYPAGYAGALGVAASDLSGSPTDASIHGPHVALAAPGEQIVTSSAAGGDCAYAADVPATSYAAGYVSAAAALVAAAYPGETPAQWAYRLQATAVRPDPDARDDETGWGIVQPYDALTLTPGSGIRGPTSPFLDAPPPAAGDAAVAPIAVVDDPGADAAAIRIAMITGLGALVVLGAVGALSVLVTRRRSERASQATTASTRGGGLYGDSPPL